jgi:hypothetical protein
MHLNYYIFIHAFFNSRAYIYITLINSLVPLPFACMASTVVVLELLHVLFLVPIMLVCNFQPCWASGRLSDIKQPLTIEIGSYVSSAMLQPTTFPAPSLTENIPFPAVSSPDPPPLPFLQESMFLPDPVIPTFIPTFPFPKLPPIPTFPYVPTIPFPFVPLPPGFMDSDEGKGTP